MSTDQHKALLRRFIDLWNTGQTTAAAEFVHPNLVDHSLPPGMPPGLDGFKLLVQIFRGAFPDLHITIDEIAAQGDRATARVGHSDNAPAAWRGSGTGCRVVIDEEQAFRM